MWNRKYDHRVTNKLRDLVESLRSTDNPARRRVKSGLWWDIRGEVITHPRFSMQRDLWLRPRPVDEVER